MNLWEYMLSFNIYPAYCQRGWEGVASSDNSNVLANSVGLVWEANQKKTKTFRRKPNWENRV